MSATTDARTAAVVALLCLLYCCCTALEDAKTVPKSRHDHVRTRSTARENRKQNNMSANVSKESENIRVENDGGVLRDYLIKRPSNIFRNLMKYGVNMVQSGMDMFEGVSSTVFRTARQSIGGTRRSARQTSSPDKPDGKRSSSRRSSTRQRSVEADQQKPEPGFVGGLGRSVINIIDTGIAGVEQITDLSLLLGNIGTHRILAKLNGQDGNKEVMNLLIKYLASRVEMASKGDVSGLIDDVGTITSFIAKDDNVTNSISTLMERFMGNRKVRTAMVRIAINVLHSSPSTSCLLDRLPLKPSDVRMMFDVFVGSNGQIMLKTIAGLLSELTTGPDTKAFLESALGMMTMFKTDNSAGSAGSTSEKPKSMMGSLASLFMGGDEEGEDDDVVSSQPQEVNMRKKETNNKSAPVSKPVKKKSIPREEEDSWFSSSPRSLDDKDSKSSQRIDSQEGKRNLNPKLKKIPGNSLGSSEFNDDTMTSRSKKSVLISKDKNNNKFPESSVYSDG